MCFGTRHLAHTGAAIHQATEPVSIGRGVSVSSPTPCICVCMVATR